MTAKSTGKRLLNLGTAQETFFLEIVINIVNQLVYKISAYKRTFFLLVC